MTPPRGALGLLGDRTFGLFFLGNLVSNSGAWIHNVAAAVVVFDLTGSAVYTGAVSAALWMGSLVLQPWAGALSDRFDRRRMLMVGQLVAFACAAGLTIFSIAVGGAAELPGPWPVIGATAGIGLGVAFSMPAMMALVPSLVPESDLDPAVALTSITFNLARATGPAISALLLYLGDATLAFGANALSYLVLLGILTVIRPREIVIDRSGDGRVREGLRYVRNSRRAMLLLVGSAGIGFASDPVNTLTPLLADELGGSDALVGLLVSAFGTGAAIGALSVGMARRRFSLAQVGQFGGIWMALGLIIFALSPGPVVAMLGMLVAGSGFLLSVTSHNTNLQRDLPEELRGRVMALVGSRLPRNAASFGDGRRRFGRADLGAPRGRVLCGVCPQLGGRRAARG